MALGETTRDLFGSVREAFRGGVQLGRRPYLDVTVVLPAAAGALSQGVVAPSVSAALGTAAAALGVPLRPRVVVEQSGDVAVPRLLIGGRRIRFVSSELSDALAARGLDSAWEPDRESKGFVAAVTTACRVAVERDPSVLIGPGQWEVLVTRARAAGIHDFEDGMLAAALTRVVRNGVSVEDLARLQASLERHDGFVNTAGELSELAIDTLRPPSVGVSMREADLRAATITGMRRNAFVDLRQRLFADLGVTFPDIEVTIDDQLPDHTAVVRLNHVRLAPRPLPTTAGILHIAKLVERCLREKASWFVSLSEVQRTVEDLRFAFPDLVSTVQERYSDPRLALFARTFVEEGVRVRNAARLMVLLLDAPAASIARDVVRLAEPARGAELGGDDIVPQQLVSYARQQINEELARSRPGVVVRASRVRLPADLEAAFDAVPLQEETIREQVSSTDLDRLIDLAEERIARGDPVLVAATQRSRAVARMLLGNQYCEMTVLAAEEYPPVVQLSPIERT
jgi:type III secretory pathway component EscV